ncbi:isocitrate lyase/PEP mutase family protein [Shewanella surugensis]|uniref:Isocitrate lyase/PEP mutase family protein n=1 Tax=Shewanella surugensis TaxID=212020 RepID=A0ABT0LEI9_9GAMM|nr:isocitrate lyase/PEP mutase family protein [Shewanella surugensis]MCL1125910.1 isocitrate lyase/PEP mutase family protein [Shewanella surugensis]
MPCAFDALSAKLIEQADFSLTLMSGFGVSASRLAMPDTGLISYHEMLEQGHNICQAVTIPVFGDADTGYGNVMNVQRTLHGYIHAGFAGIMLEDQQSPKRCGHTKSKQVVSRLEAIERITAAVDAREKARKIGGDIVIIARTDARATLGLDEAIIRGKAFQDLGADVIFSEAPHSVDEMDIICREISAAKMANMIEQGVTPVLPPAQLESMGFKLAAYPLSLLVASVEAMQQTLLKLKLGEKPDTNLSFQALQQHIGFHDYDEELKRLSKKEIE